MTCQQALLAAELLGLIKGFAVGLGLLFVWILLWLYFVGRHR